MRRSVSGSKTPIRIVGDGSDRGIPHETDEIGIKKIYRYKHSTPESVANEIYEYVTKLKR